MDVRFEYFSFMRMSKWIDIRKNALTVRLQQIYIILLFIYFTLILFEFFHKLKYDLTISGS